MDDLIVFLRRCLDAEERAAQAADVKQSDPEWFVSPVLASGGRHFTVRSKRDNRPIARAERLDGDDDEPAAILDGEAVAEHIALHNPARVLARVAADRKIVDWCAEVIGDRDLGTYDEFGSLKDDPAALAVTLAVETLRLLAQPRADREGWREEWRVTDG